MSEEKKTIELNEEDLEKVTGGSKAGDDKFDNVTQILTKVVDTLYLYIYNDSVYSNIVSAKDAQFHPIRFSAIKHALETLTYYKNSYIRRIPESVYNQVVSDLNTCLRDSEN